MARPVLAVNPNLMPNSGLASDLAGAGGAVVTATYVASLGRAARSIRVARTAAGDAYWISAYNIAGALLVGQPYTVSFLARANRQLPATFSAGVQVQGPVTGITDETFAVGTDVRRYSYTIPAAEAGGTDNRRIVFRSGPNVGDWVEYSDIKIENGTQATPWVLAAAEGGRAIADPGATMDRFYDTLPDHHRESDEAGGFPLYRFAAGTVQQLAEVEALIDGIDYDDAVPGDTSVLADPTVAPLGTLPWLAQLVGVPLRADLTDTEKRDAVQFASSGWRAGTKQAIADAARSELTGTKFARVYDHSITQPGDGGEWDVLIITRSTETPDVTRVLQAVTRRAAKPAGVVLRHRAYESTWDTVTATYPTWVTVEGAGSWNRIQEAGL